MNPAADTRLLFEGPDWTFETMDRTHHAIEEIALDDLGLDVYPNQIEIISTEQMLDAYSSLGVPLMYSHWSFGKRFAREEKLYRKGYIGLAYEIVINANPCISYNLADNSMALQTLVMAHAAFGHNHFFKNNYVFRQWTDAEGVIDTFQYAKSFVAECEDRYGVGPVEEILDSAHALMDQGVFRYRRPPKLTERAREARELEREEYEDSSYRDIWRTVPKSESNGSRSDDELALAERKRTLRLPEENLLYFMECYSPVLEDWQREILRIVRNAAQYFYPQRQTKVMNEGCATFVHHFIANALYDRRLIAEGTLLEMLHHHANVILQTDYDDPRYTGISPYALGFAMMEDIRRICTEPTKEDEIWFPEFAGNGDWRGVLKDAWKNFRDESFIRQFLSPRLARRFRMFALTDDAADSHYTVAGIHDESGYKCLRETLADSYDPGVNDPDIQVVDADLRGDRELVLQHTVRSGIPLVSERRDEVLKHIRCLWGYPVTLMGLCADNGEIEFRVTLKESGSPEDVPV